MFAPNQLRRPSLLDQLRSDRDADAIYRYNNALGRMKEAELPYASSTAEAKNMFELQKALEKQEQAGLAGQYNRNEPMRFALESGHKGAQIGKEQALMGKYGAQTNKENLLTQKELMALKNMQADLNHPLQIFNRFKGLPEVEKTNILEAIRRGENPMTRYGQMPNASNQPMIPGGMKSDLSQQAMNELNAGPPSLQEMGAAGERPMNLNLTSGQAQPSPARLLPPQGYSPEDEAQRQAAFAKESDYVQRLRDKRSSQPWVIRRDLFATNMQKMLDRTINDPMLQEALDKYGGYGDAKFLKQKALNAFNGVQDPLLDRYDTWRKTDKPELAEQFRQMLSTSITKPVHDLLESMLGDTSLFSTPAQIRQQWQSIQDILKLDHETFQDQLGSAAVKKSKEGMGDINAKDRINPGFSANDIRNRAKAKGIPLADAYKELVTEKKSESIFSPKQEEQTMKKLVLEGYTQADAMKIIEEQKNRMKGGQ